MFSYSPNHGNSLEFTLWSSIAQTYHPAMVKSVFKFTRLHWEFLRDNKLWISSTFYLRSYGKEQLLHSQRNQGLLHSITEHYFWSEFVILEEPDKSAHSAKEKSNKDKGATHPHVL